MASSPHFLILFLVEEGSTSWLVEWKNQDGGFGILGFFEKRKLDYVVIIELAIEDILDATWNKGEKRVESFGCFYH